MNNLTKIAALPTGGGCQSALRPEDRGAERKPLTHRKATELCWEALYRNEPVIDWGVESDRGFSVAELVEADPAVSPLASDGYVMCRSTRGSKAITAPAKPGDQVETVSVEPVEGPCIGVAPVLTMDFAAPLDAEEFMRNWRAMNERLDRGCGFWPDPCRADLKVSVEPTSVQMASCARLATLKGGSA